MKEKRPFSPEEFKEIFSKVPRLCVDLIVQTPGGIILTLRKLPSWHGQWHIPGGMVMYKEKLADAINRVAKEELGISVSVKRLLGYTEYPSEERERGFGWSVGLEFLCEIKDGDVRVNKDAFEVRVFDILPENMIKEHKEFIKSHKIIDTK